MNVIYHCYGGAHSSVMAAAIHLGRITEPEKVSTREVLALPYFDMQDQAELGRIRRVGADAAGNSVFVLGRGNLSRLAVRVLTSCARGLRIDPRSYLLADVLTYVNPIMVVGGSLSRRYKVVGPGRAIVAEGTRRAAPYLAGGVERAKAKMADQAKIDAGQARCAAGPIIIYHCYGNSYPAALAAALHTRVFRQDERPRLPRDVWETLRRHPVGEVVAFGQDRQGNLVMACGFGPGNELVSHALSDFLEVSGIDPERVTFVDVSGLRNVPLRLGAFLLSHRMAPELGRHLLETGYMTQGRRFGEIVEHRRHISPAIDPSRPAGG